MIGMIIDDMAMIFVQRPQNSPPVQDSIFFWIRHGVGRYISMFRKRFMPPSS